jgi:hypothetical protein
MLEYFSLLFWVSIICYLIWTLPQAGTDSGSDIADDDCIALNHTRRKRTLAKGIARAVARRVDVQWQQLRDCIDKMHVVSYRAMVILLIGMQDHKIKYPGNARAVIGVYNTIWLVVSGCHVIYICIYIYTYYWCCNCILSIQYLNDL